MEKNPSQNINRIQLYIKKLYIKTKVMLIQGMQI